MIYAMFSGGGGETETLLIVNYFLISYVTGSVVVTECQNVNQHDYRSHLYVLRPLTYV